MASRRGFTLIECCLAAWLVAVALLALAGALAAAHRSQRATAAAAATRAAAADERERTLGDLSRDSAGAPGPQAPTTPAGGAP